MDQLRSVRFLHPYLSVDSERELTNTLWPCLRQLDGTIRKGELKKAVAAGFAAYRAYKEDLRREGEAALAWARAHGRRIMVLAGRPYHVDPEVGHGIDKLATSLGFVVVSEDSVCHLAPVQYVKVLDQWTFHARLRRGRHHRRRGARHSGTQRQVLHTDQDRRDHQPGRGAHSAAQSVGRAGGERTQPCRIRASSPLQKI